ncbi:MAG: hypothetical protein GY832_44490 [Chloroflexi bacterium]|nr:hypothetical protein [Chloroflexota bacterium]
MLEIHGTRKGNVMLIAQMGDDHLCNMISLVIRKAREVKAMADRAAGFDAYQQRLYNVKQVTQEDAAEATRMALQKLYPYLAEAYLRGLEGPRLELVDFLGREEALTSDIPLLNAPEDDWCTYEDMDRMPINGEEAREMAW